jgi:hypothetical protein
LGSLADATRAASAAYGVGLVRTARRARRLRARQGFRYDEALREGLLDPGVPDDALAGYASRHSVLEAQARVNPEALAALTGEKVIFHRFCEAAGLPVAQLVAVIDRAGAGWAPPTRLFTTGDGFAAVLAAGPAEVVVKPSGGAHGHGVRILVRHGDRLAEHTGRDLTAAELWDELRADADFGCFLVEERLRDHPDLAAIVDAPALQTLRVATLVRADGTAEVLQAAIRLALGGGPVDNFGDGAAGNGYAEIDPATGVMGPLRLAGPGGVGLRTLETVPATGDRIAGVRVPGWEAARDLALEAAVRFLPARSLGWDIALTPRGPVLVEGNRCWHPWTTSGASAMLRRMLDDGRSVSADAIGNDSTRPTRSAVAVRRG